MQTDPTETRLRELMLASLDGDAAAYRALLADLGRHLRPYFTRRLTPAFASHAEDLVQETLLAIHTRRMTYDRTRPFTAWLHAVAHHKFVDHVRRQSIRLTVPLEDDAPIFAHDDHADATAKRDLDVVLDAVPERTSDLIRRTRVQGATIAEAAAHHGITETAAKVSIHRGLKSLVSRFSGGEK
ncbi:sigma-70 family RNA polymerase sigma factor [Devosia sp. J2-20]|jgi:RNA polymerase sigma factor (sigma-70 family)|uniref:sigma-70 family RNA polymerase sigma factor n=1 Tax=Devosia TaxID=46913 RepID=UPI002016A149|nr:MULTISPECIES: sigma-70 family RNA polymerase sigma factor [Devosia]MCZ4347208.1 sigma-70 family RNA polymerase sigma factor [Devosia neptuniae]WDQ99446.1 sigma-70 family RNA polymerase sigma factor [Devosia sp. J2-20]|tara:strand:+ start:1850 stop:2401 length:552 start_codon:yes stop_codon:yes gene_type:complete